MQNEILKLKIFFDGDCHLCFREVMHYKKLDKDKNLLLFDISAKDFNPQDFGLNENEVYINMHAIDANGNVFQAIDCFIEIWKRVPPYNRLIPVFKNRILRPIINCGYTIFARQIRPRLPKRGCENGKCEIYQH
jgi:predicted DCC family thiol-disulfide oxidoreductase YuxK